MIIAYFKETGSNEPKYKVENHSNLRNTEDFPYDIKAFIDYVVLDTASQDFLEQLRLHSSLDELQGHETLTGKIAFTMGSYEKPPWTTEFEQKPDGEYSGDLIEMVEKCVKEQGASAILLEPTFASEADLYEQYGFSESSINGESFDEKIHLLIKKIKRP
ncbi:hypothetical protein HOL21_00205 [Candidatus Woesearchaeota archaeon]|jgi:hypothetical protein|nr:hypothetical protein [Candidatus Woesearchaeota archaeon]MBT5396619.1 hypothetical protein [Candidatus Woesearchaeota archaeon]MBT6367594.1 hypothetical protein [Candidatus Woesearchaeota archaeon]MBT7763093.1 hypothetical protein [Candidatus Woesearchaeota archaeon]